MQLDVETSDEIRSAPQRPASHRERHAVAAHAAHRRDDSSQARSEEHTSELQSLMRISYAVFCLKKKKKKPKKANTYKKLKRQQQKKGDTTTKDKHITKRAETKSGKITIQLEALPRSI